MTKLAKVIAIGNRQAVRLPKEFHIAATEMWISKNDLTGEITLRPKTKASALDRLFKMIGENPLDADFLTQPSRRNPNPPLSTGGGVERC